MLLWFFLGDFKHFEVFFYSFKSAIILWKVAKTKWWSLKILNLPQKVLKLFTSGFSGLLGSPRKWHKGKSHEIWALLSRLMPTYVSHVSTFFSPAKNQYTKGNDWMYQKRRWRASIPRSKGSNCNTSLLIAKWKKHWTKMWSNQFKIYQSRSRKDRNVPKWILKCQNISQKNTQEKHPKNQYKRGSDWTYQKRRRRTSIHYSFENQLHH